MAMLTKEQFEKRNENAARRNAENKAIAIENGMPPDIAEMVVTLCAERHKFHSLDIDAFFNGEHADCEFALSFIAKNIEDGNGILYISALESHFGCKVFDDVEIIDLPCDDDWFYVFDDEDKAKFGDDFTAFKDASIGVWMDVRNKVNNQIEAFLAKLDAQFKTSFAPTGSQRIY